MERVGIRASRPVVEPTTATGCQAGTAASSETRCTTSDLCARGRSCEAGTTRRWGRRLSAGP